MADEFEEVIDVHAEEVAEPGEETRSAPEGAPVIAAVRSLERPPSLPAVRAAAVAATGFAAGAAAAALVRRRSTRRLSRSHRGDHGEGLALLSTHTYLIRVHVLGRPAE